MGTTTKRTGMPKEVPTPTAPDTPNLRSPMNILSGITVTAPGLLTTKTPSRTNSSGERGLQRERQCHRTSRPRYSEETQPRTTHSEKSLAPRNSPHSHSSFAGCPAKQNMQSPSPRFGAGNATESHPKQLSKIRINKPLEKASESSRSYPYAGPRKRHAAASQSDQQHRIIPQTTLFIPPETSFRN